GLEVLRHLLIAEVAVAVLVEETEPLIHPGVRVSAPVPATAVAPGTASRSPTGSGRRPGRRPARRSPSAPWPAGPSAPARSPVPLRPHPFAGLLRFRRLRVGNELLAC